MNALTILVWIFNVILDTAGHILLKKSTHTVQADYYWSKLCCSYLLWLGIACFVGEFILWLALVSLLPLGTSVLLIAFNTVSIAIAGWLILHEKLKATDVCGILLIIAGVLLVGWAV